MSEKAQARTSVLQFEVARTRLAEMSRTTKRFDVETATTHVYDVIRAALTDTLENCGTFVCVVTAEKITVVQREDTEDL